MIRRVSFQKAIAGGLAGALAWEVFSRLLIAAGLPLFDNTRILGSMITGHTNGAAWWPVGLAAHAVLGTVWAIFYAYFFWSTFDWSPTLQGMLFSLIPAVLAGLIVIPQIGYMHPLVQSGKWPAPGLFGLGWGWGAPIGEVLGHLVYGTVLGTIYRRPVGYPAWRTVVPFA